MKKYFLLVLLVLIIASACSKESKNESGDDRLESINGDESGESSGETDYEVRVDPDLIDESAKLFVFRASWYEDFVVTGKVEAYETIEIDAKEGIGLRKELDKIVWHSDNMLDRMPCFIDAGLQYEDSEEKFYFSFAGKTVYYLDDLNGVEIGKLTDELLDSIISLCPGRTKDLEFDENGLLTESACIAFTQKCVQNYLDVLRKNPDSFVRQVFSPDDDPEDYAYRVSYNDDGSVNVVVEQQKNWYSYFNFTIDRKVAAVKWGTMNGGRPGLYESKVEYEEYSYEGLKVNYSLMNDEGTEFSDGHYRYSNDYRSGYLYLIKNEDGYKAEPVKDVMADARKYFDRLFPGYGGKDSDWKLEEEGNRTVKYLCSAYGYPVEIAAFYYDEENRFTGAYIQMGLLAFIKDENELIKYEEAAETSGRYLKLDYPGIKPEDFNITAQPDINENGHIIWRTRFISGSNTYVCEIDAVTGEKLMTGMELDNE